MTLAPPGLADGQGSGTAKAALNRLPKREIKMRSARQTARKDQLGFDILLAETDAINAGARFEKSFGHLPGTMDAAVPHYPAIIARHHDAMFAGHIDQAMELRKEAEALALRLNNGEPGILAGPDAPGCALANLTAAPDGEVPLWGQQGSFILDLPKVRVRIEMDGIFGIGGRFSPWMNFAAHATHRDRPLINETGYRSFMGIRAAIVSGLTPESFARLVIEAHIKDSLKGKLVRVAERHQTAAASD